MDYSLPLGFFKKQKRCLGLDVGASGIKVVELFRDKDQICLGNYAISQTKIGSSYNVAKLNPDDLALLCQKLFGEAGIISKKAVISLPVSDTFSTIIDLPQMAEQELSKAIPYEARKYVPVPMEEVVLDWSVVGEFSGNAKVEPNKEGKEGKDYSLYSQEQIQSGQVSTGKNHLNDGEGSRASKTIQVLIVAVPQEIIKRIAQMAKKIDLEVIAVEQEAFSIVRALVGGDRNAYLVGDLGDQSCDLVIIDEGAIRITHTFEKIKPEELAAEASKIVNLYETRYARKIIKVILTGGGVTRPEWVEILGSCLPIKIEMGNPFAKLVYDPKLSSSLQQLGPFMSVAVGSAMREI